MKNIEKLAQHITKHGTQGILIHVIPKTNNWLICQKITKNLWNLSLQNPMGYAIFNLGTITSAQHIALWEGVTLYKIKEKIKQHKLAQELKETINNFIKAHTTPYNLPNQNQNTPHPNKQKIIKELKEKITNFKLTH